MGCGPSSDASAASAPADAKPTSPSTASSTPVAAKAVATTSKSGGVTTVGTTISLELDGCFVSFDKVRRQFIVTSKTGSVTTVGQIPARPAKGGAAASPSLSAGPVTAKSMSGNAEKLGHRKIPITGAHSWQPRFFKLSGTTLTYYAAEGDSTPKGEVTLAAGCVAKVIQAEDAARKDRFDDNDASMVGMLTQPMGAMMDTHSGPIGKPNCVEFHVPPQIGNMLGGVMNNSALGLAAGGAADIKKNQARTYYWSCSSLEEAKQWADALNNNVKLAKAPSANSGTTLPGGVSLGAVDAAMHMAQNLQADQKNMVDPNESLGWYQRALKTDLSLDDLHAKLMTFYDALHAAGAC